MKKKLIISSLIGFLRPSHLAIFFSMATKTKNLLSGASFFHLRSFNLENTNNILPPYEIIITQT